jgi:hypothetical protein
VRQSQPGCRSSGEAATISDRQKGLGGDRFRDRSTRRRSRARATAFNIRRKQPRARASATFRIRRASRSPLPPAAESSHAGVGRSRRRGCPFAAAARGVVDLKIVAHSGTSGRRVDTAVGMQQPALGFAGFCFQRIVCSRAASNSPTTCWVCAQARPCGVGAEMPGRARRRVPGWPRRAEPSAAASRRVARVARSAPLAGPGRVGPPHPRAAAAARPPARAPVFGGCDGG